jgi:hypothetical protein
MAVSVDQLTAITHRFIMPKMYDNIFDSNPLLKRLLSSGQYKSVDGGTSIDIPLNYAQQSAAGWFSGADTLDTSDSENISVARYDWKSLYAGISITEEDEMKNGGSKGVLKLLASKAQIAEKTIKDQLGTGLYSDGTTAKSIIGLRDIVATDQTVGGIAQSTNSFWQGIVDSTTTTLTIAAMNTVFENASIDSEKPTVGVTTRTNYTRYYNLLQPQQRFTDGETAKAGWSNLMFNGVALLADSHVPANHLFFLNEKHLWLCYHPEMNFTSEPFQRPINQRVKVSRIVWMGAFGSSNNRLHAKMSALTA